jgi:hypothetical protein
MIFSTWDEHSWSELLLGWYQERLHWWVARYQLSFQELIVWGLLVVLWSMMAALDVHNAGCIGAQGNWGRSRLLLWQTLLEESSHKVEKHRGIRRSQQCLMGQYNCERHPHRRELVGGIAAGLPKPRTQEGSAGWFNCDWNRTQTVENGLEQKLPAVAVDPSVSTSTSKFMQKRWPPHARRQQSNDQYKCHLGCLYL